MARRLLGCALEVRYRLPRLWEAVVSGSVSVGGGAKLVAEATMTLCEEGAEHVDVHVNGFTHAVSGAQLDRIVAVALARLAARGRREPGARPPPSTAV